MTTDRALIVAPEPGALTTKQILDGLSTVRGVLAPELTDDELRLFAMVANRSGLDPFAKQVYAVKRGGRVTFQTGIDGYRSTAARTGEYMGSDEPEFGPIIEQPFPHPEWARTTVHRRLPDGTLVHQSATAWWAEFYPGAGQDSMWRKMPRNQLAKCSEALALRKAFPFVLSDVYTAEEMDQANRDIVSEPAKPTAAERIAERRARAEQAEQAIEGEFTEAPVPDDASPAPGGPPETGERGRLPGTSPSPDAGAARTQPQPSVCGDASPFTEGVVCDQPEGHPNVHRNDATGETWPQKAARR